MSAASDVAGAMKSAIEALTLPSVTVARRKSPSVPEGAVLPQVVISIGEERTEYLTATDSLITYPLAVTVVTKGGQKLADDDTVHDWLQQIRRKMEARATFAAVAGFNAIEAGGAVPYDAAALAKDFNYSSIAFRVSVIEPRT